MGTRTAMTHVSPQYATHVIIMMIHCIDNSISDVIIVIIIVIFVVVISNAIISIVMPIYSVAAA